MNATKNPAFNETVAAPLQIPRQERLESPDLLARILAHRPDLVSLDVFDTLLWRPCRRPVDLFQRLGEELLRKGHLHNIDPAGFSRFRIHAEQTARFSGPGPEVTHLEITSELAKLLGQGDGNVLADEEFQVEGECLFGYLEIFQLLTRLRHEGIPYALCSDMYFSSIQITSFLKNAAERLGITISEPALVLVSGDHRTGKSDRLFDLLLAKTGIPAARILHIGDNPVSDAAKPRAKGIRAIHLPRTCETAEAVLDAEEKYLVAGKSFQSDFGLATTRKELLAESHLANAGKLTHRAYGAFVAGPVFAAFAAWVVLECRRQGLRRVDCILREGHFLSRLLDQAKTVLGVELEVRTILSSRFCLRAASLADASEKGLVEFLRNVRPLDVQADLFEYLGLFEKADTAEWLRLAMDTAEWTDRVGYALRVFRENPAAAGRVSRLAAQRKQGLLAYLQGRNLSEGGDLVFVDLGWGGTMQVCALPFLRELGFTGAARGFYLGTDHRIERLPSDDCPWQSLFYKAGQPIEEARIVQRTPELLEQFCMSPHGSLLEFRPDGEPVFHSNRLPEAQIRETAEIQAGILDFSARWLPRYLQSGGNTNGGESLEALSNRLRAVISRSLDAPRPEEVALFAEWRHDSNNGSEDCRCLLGDLHTIEGVKSGAITHPSQLDWLRSYWPQGLLTHLGIEWSRGGRGGLLKRWMKISTGFLPGGEFAVSRLHGFWKTLRPRLGMVRFRLRITLARWRWRKSGQTQRPSRPADSP